MLTTDEAYVDEGAEAVFQRNSKAREGAMIRDANYSSIFAKAEMLWLDTLSPNTPVGYVSVEITNMLRAYRG